MIVKIGSSGTEKELSSKIKIGSDGSEKECQKIVRIDGSGAEEEIWSNLKAYDLGYGTTFNMQTLMPDVDYTQLTADNFYVITASGTSWSDGQDDGIWYQRTYFTKSYNASTGVLTCYFWCSKTTNGWCRVCYVNNPDKLVAFSDMKTKYSTKWQNFTANNIIAKSFSPTEDLIGVGSPYGISANSYMSKGYDVATGTLSSFYFMMYFALTRTDPSSLTSVKSSSGIYVIPELLSLS